jgi:hypothetical protein
VPVPQGWLNPITAKPGTSQNVPADLLLPSRPELVRGRLDLQRALVSAGQARFSPIQVTPDGVIWDGHHGARVAAELGLSINVNIVNVAVQPVGLLLLDLPVR